MLNPGMKQPDFLKKPGAKRKKSGKALDEESGWRPILANQYWKLQGATIRV